MRSWTKSLGMGPTVGVVSALEEWPWRRGEETSFKSSLNKGLLTWTSHGIPTRKGERGELLLLSSAIILLYFNWILGSFFWPLWCPGGNCPVWWGPCQATVPHLFKPSPSGPAPLSTKSRILCLVVFQKLPSSQVESFCQVTFSQLQSPLHWQARSSTAYVGFSLVYDLLMGSMKFSLKQTAVSHSFVTFLIYTLKH